MTKAPTINEVGYSVQIVSMLEWKDAATWVQKGRVGSLMHAVTGKAFASHLLLVASPIPTHTYAPTHTCVHTHAGKSEWRASRPVSWQQVTYRFPYHETIDIAAQSKDIQCDCKHLRDIGRETCSGPISSAASTPGDVTALINEAWGHPNAVAWEVAPHLFPVLPLVVDDRVPPIFLLPCPRLAISPCVAATRCCLSLPSH